MARHAIEALVRLRTPMRSRALAFLLVLLHGACQVAAAAEPAPRDFEMVIQSPRWTAFVDRVHGSFVRAVDNADLEAPCRRVLADPSAVQDDDPAGACITAALASLDSTSAYIAPKQLAADRERAKDPYVAIGLELATRPPGTPLTIVTPIQGAPAERAGVRAGDRIVAIDGTDVLPLTTDDITKLLRGAPGSAVTLTLLRGDAATPLAITIKREEVRLSDVRVRRLDDTLVYVRISRFSENTTNEFSTRLESALQGAHPGGLIIDLRGNSGGLFDQVVGIGTAFARSLDTLVVSVRMRKEPMMFRAGDGSSRTKPVAPRVREWLASVSILVLVDAKTASGAEALAQFLREHRDARLVGVRTFGHGTVNTVFLLDRAAAVKLATGEMVSPQGVRWASSGLPVDVEVADPGKFEYADTNDIAFARARQLLQPR